MSTTPPIASDPKRADCAPRSTSTRPTSAVPSVPKSNATCVPDGSETSIPSMRTATFCCGTPRIVRAERVPTGPFARTETPGVRASTSTTRA